MSLHAKISGFCQRFLTHWNARAFDDAVACFAEPALFVLPTGTVSLPNTAAMVAMLRRLFARIEADGFCHTKLGPVSVRECGLDLAVVDVAHVCRWCGDGSRREEIDGHCVLQRQNGGWHATVAFACSPGWRG